MRDYVGAPGLTARHFLPPDARGHAGFVTSDRGFVDKDGLLFVSGRSDSLIKLRGFRLSPDEIEDAICRMLPVVQAAITLAALEGEPPDAAPERLVAHVVLAEGARCDRAAFRAALARALPEPAIPSAFLSVACLPTRPNGKVDRAALPRRIPAAAAGGRRGGAPRPGTEATLAAIWKRILKLEEIGRDEAFADLGGSSLSALEVVLEIERSLNRALPDTILSEYPTIAALAARLDDHGHPPDPVLSHLRPGPGARLVFFSPLDGDGLGFVKFIPELPPDTDVLSLKCRALAQKDAALPSDVDRLVPILSDRIAALPPRRPLILAGNSYGGVIAFAMSRALAAQGLEVASVLLLDTYGPGCRRRNAAAAPVADSAVADATVTIVPGKPVVLAPTASDLVLIRADAPNGLACTPDYGWARMTTGTFRLLQIEGDHSTIMHKDSVPIVGPTLRELIRSLEKPHDP